MSALFDPLLISILAGTMASAAGVCVAVAAWSLRAGRPPTQRRVDAFVKNTAAQPQRAQDLAGGRRARGTRVAAGPESRNRFLRRLEQSAEKAHADIRPPEILGIGAGFGILFALAIVLATGIGLLAIPAFIIGMYVPLYWLRRRAKKLAKAFHKQLADTVTLLASAVRAGNALPRAFERVASEAPEPTKGAFGAAVREMGLGAPLEETLDRVAEKYPSEEMDLLVASVNVQYQVGGNLTKVLDLIAETLRERIRIQGDISSLTSSQRYSAYLLSALPVVVALFLFLISPSYISILFKGGFIVIPIVAGVLVLVGFLTMQQLAKVEV